jgi:large subunit ribosomal protein L18
MAKNKPKTILYRRKREKRTNYAKRLKLLLSKKSRLVVRITNQRLIAQIVDFDAKGDKVVAAVDSFALKKLGWVYSCKNFPAAYLTGLLLGKKALEKGHKEAILDTGFHFVLKKGKIYSFLKGVLDSGLEIPSNKEIIPDDERIKGKHIKDYAEKIKENKEVYDKIFAKCLKSNSPPEQITTLFEKTKEKIIAQ